MSRQRLGYDDTSVGVRVVHREKGSGTIKRVRAYKNGLVPEKFAVVRLDTPWESRMMRATLYQVSLVIVEGVHRGEWCLEEEEVFPLELPEGGE